MKAYRNVGGDVREIDVDVDLKGSPILPPDTTVDARPEALPGHYVTVVGKSWVQIEIPVAVVSFETKKQQKLNEISQYAAWYQDQPLDINGVKFDADEKARIRLSQALVIHLTLGQIPPAWITYDNAEFPLTTIDELKGISAAVHQAFQTRFFECNALRQAALVSTDDASLDAVVVPKKPNIGLVA